MSTRSRLLQLDIPLDVPTPLGKYVAVAVRGRAGYVSGQFPMRDGKLAYQGKLGAEVTLQQGKEAAELAAMNAMGQLRRAAGGSLAQVQLARIDGYIAAAPGFLDLPAVLDGASEAFVDFLGERGAHARAVFAVPQLPMNAPIELVVTFHIVQP